MTGWRLGWAVVPASSAHAVEKLAQNLYINAPTLSQHAALACWDSDAIAELEAHRQRYAKNRAIVLHYLTQMGLCLNSEVSPATGAFYVYFDLRRFGVHAKPKEEAQNEKKCDEALWKMTSVELCRRVLDEAYVALAPGVDFEDPSSDVGLSRVRISYSRGTPEVEEGMKRLLHWWQNNVVQ
eukprot:CAMPEP_0185849160 /NCGR_PEP_ID=MMETSP1354-20130828/3760_1 /TAXON_ID=708628 /ORGANISM="Erythrolobus madagascarensis, Strain CCMP3276" /LENGTH=181 /DNA_ID=CAMNT_0028549643 /DNA_START=143 /DNA_END=688 /DNA_ORIENTATION=+